MPPPSLFKPLLHLENQIKEATVRAGSLQIQIQAMNSPELRSLLEALQDIHTTLLEALDHTKEARARDKSNRKHRHLHYPPLKESPR